jgi:predicted nuclease with TOPRIM domain
MLFHSKLPCRILWFLILVISFGVSGFGGVSRAIQEQYKRDFENKAMFLKIPVYSEKQLVYISGQTIRPAQGSGTPRFKVGDQLRILLVEFSNEEIKFRMGGIGTQGFVEIGFRFDANLQENFPNKDVFDRALQSTFTEGLKYTEIEDAKRGFVEDQFDRSVREMAESASLNRDSVLKSIAPRVPAYQDAQREIETLKNKVQDVSSQLSQAQTENRKLEAETRSQQTELSRLKAANAALQEKIDTSTSQISRLGDELRDVKGTAQGYQKELASLQRSLNLKVDSNRDLGMQIAELGQALRKLQKDNETLTNQIASLRTNLESQQAANSRLLGENEELKSSNAKMKSTIATLTSKDDSLARQYLELKNAKEKLDDFSQTISALRTRIGGEKTSDGYHTGKVNVYLKNVLLGSLTWSIPAYLNHSESKTAEVAFMAESVDYVRLTPEERHLLRTLGEKLKIRMDLTSDSATMDVAPEKGARLHELKERDSSTWRWTVSNNGAEDVRLVLSAHLVNRNSDEISLFQQENAVISSNVIRQLRTYLQPVSLAVGVLLGFLLFGIAGIFRRSKHRDTHPKNPTGPSAPSSYVAEKKL